MTPNTKLLKRETTRDVKAGVYVEIAKIILATLIAFAALEFTAGWTIDLENLAKGKQNTSRIEMYEGIPYTAYNVKDIKALITRRVGSDTHLKRVLWLGNSQLHYINQYHDGDHLSPHWLRLAWKTPDYLEPLGCSMPNANFQEYLVLSRYAADRIPVHLLIAELVFDKLREDGLRGDFSEIITPESISEIQNSSKTAEVILRRFLASCESGKGGKDVLAGTIQQPVERWLNNRMSASWKLWAERPQIEGNFLLALYNLRNWTFGIKPTTVRKMIKARYDLNMDALRDMLDNFRLRGIPVLLYIAPIRQDKPIPYDAAAYALWKREVAVMARSYGARIINLEKLVPGNKWGSYMGNDIDFMHFQGEGHRLVAEALLPHVEAMLKEEKN